MKRSIRDRFRRPSDKRSNKTTSSKNDTNSAKSRILNHYFPNHDLHPLNPDYVSPSSSKPDVIGKKSEESKEDSKSAQPRTKPRGRLPHYRISKETFSVKKQYEGVSYAGIPMPKHSKSYKLKRTERYINDPESYTQTGESKHSSSSKKSSRAREKKDRNSHRSYQSTNSARSNPEEEEYENTGRNRERFEEQLQREINDLTRKNHIPFSTNRAPEPDNRNYDNPDPDNGRNGPPRDPYLPPPAFPPVAGYPGYPAVPPTYPFSGPPPPYPTAPAPGQTYPTAPAPGQPYPAAPAPGQPYPFPAGYPNGLPYAPAPFGGGTNAPVGHLNQSPTNLNYYNYSSPPDGRPINLPLVPPASAYNPFVYNVEVNNQKANTRQASESNRPRDIVGVSTNQKQIYSGNDGSSFRGGSSNGTTNPASSHGSGPAPGSQKPFPYDWNQGQVQKKQDHKPDYAQAIENAFTFSGGGTSSRLPKHSDAKEFENNIKSKYGHNYDSYDLNSNEVKKGDKVPYVDQASYHQPTGFGHQSNSENAETKRGMANNVQYQQYNPNSNHYRHPPLKSTRHPETVHIVSNIPQHPETVYLYVRLPCTCPEYGPRVVEFEY
ncbi:unnamed protein product [Allacma fusca]|uniref:Uncharacterized protein n=1 Tax=Allacma fusca TaxID=39272 RepID=A0A8J2M463_9HEXA|nr:unnamed protein product [Allacma fusca]